MAELIEGKEEEIDVVAAYADKRQQQLGEFYGGIQGLVNDKKYGLMARPYIDDAGLNQAVIRVVDLITGQVVGDLVLERR
jgi:hypothetical protein